ncbi:hypothetical protein BZA70DRAFT_275945 [Myxozyma melibiosi]|uniref:FHA domain-containing protein n=1 Tax=Myxozyma melibiosi TaxID=54550 RepID=A0ABR1F8R2_9ASCO
MMATEEEILVTLSPRIDREDLGRGHDNLYQHTLFERQFILSTSRPEIVIGRISHNANKNIRALPDNANFDFPNVSRPHASLSFDFNPESGCHGLKLRDCHSLHGTVVEGSRITPAKDIMLHSHDIIRLGASIDYQGDTVPVLEIEVIYAVITSNKKDDSSDAGSVSRLQPIKHIANGFGIVETSESESENVLSITEQQTTCMAASDIEEVHGTTASDTCSVVDLEMTLDACQFPERASFTEVEQSLEADISEHSSPSEGTSMLKRKFSTSGDSDELVSAEMGDSLPMACLEKKQKYTTEDKNCTIRLNKRISMIDTAPLTNNSALACHGLMKDAGSASSICHNGKEKRVGSSSANVGSLILATAAGIVIGSVGTFTALASSAADKFLDDN